MKATPAQKHMANDLAYKSDCHRFSYIGGRDGIWLFHYMDGRPSELITMAEMEEKANGR